MTLKVITQNDGDFVGVILLYATLFVAARVFVVQYVTTCGSVGPAGVSETLRRAVHSLFVVTLASN